MAVAVALPSTVDSAHRTLMFSEGIAEHGYIRRRIACLPLFFPL